MESYSIIAKAVCSELNITNISKNYDITKKIKWEEPLIIKGDKLKGKENKSVYIYHFGSVIFINFTEEEIEDYIKELEGISGSIKSKNPEMKYNNTEKYKIIVGSDRDEEIDFDAFYIKKIEKYHFDMVSLVLAKSVALETIENRVDVVFDELEKVIKKLKKGKLRATEKKTISLIGKIISFKHTIISYIMLLDKPAATWKDKNIETFFNDLADFFELSDRYEKLTAKIDTLLTTADIIADLSHSKKSTKLEIIVILLILIEVINAFQDIILEFITGIISFI